MCGIVGIFNLENDKNCIIDRRTKGFMANFFLTELLLSTQARGKDATGYFSIFKDHNSMGLKHSVDASAFVFDTKADEGLKYIEHAKALEKYHTEVSEFASVIGHCRKSSVGNKRNINNHPVVLDDTWICVHNGTLTNHDEIVKVHKDDFTPNGEVDSEMIIQLANLWQKKYNADTMNTSMLRYIANRTQGGCATLITNTNDNTKVGWLRYDRPMIFAYIPTFGMLIVASDRDFITDAFTTYNKFAIYQFNLPDFEYLISAASFDSGGIIDLEQVIEKTDKLNTALIDRITNDTKIKRDVIGTYKEVSVYGSTYYGYSRQSDKNTNSGPKNDVVGWNNKADAKPDAKPDAVALPAKEDKKEDLPKDAVKCYRWSEACYVETMVGNKCLDHVSTVAKSKKNVYDLYSKMTFIRNAKTKGDLAEKLKEEMKEIGKTVWTAETLDVVKATELRTLRKVAPSMVTLKKEQKSATKARKRIITLKRFLSGLVKASLVVDPTKLYATELSKDELEFVSRLLPEAVKENAPKALLNYINQKTEKENKNESKVDRL